MQSILDVLPDQPVHSLGVFRLQVTLNGKNRCEVGTRADPWFTSAFRSEAEVTRDGLLISANDPKRKSISKLLDECFGVIKKSLTPEETL